MASSAHSSTAAGGSLGSTITPRGGAVDTGVLNAIQSQVSSLQKLADELLGKCITISEKEVMAAGDAVRAIYDETREQVSAVDHAVASLGNEAGNRSAASLGAAMKRQRELFGEFMNELSRRLEAQSAAANHALAMVAKVNEFTKKVSGLWSEARILTVNARIEAARLGEQGAGFAIIAQEMGRFTVAVAKANEATSGIAQQMADTIPAIASESDSMVAGVREFSAHLAEESNRLERVYSEAMANALDALNAANGAGKQTVERAQEVLSHLQFQDMLTQALRQMDALTKTVDANVTELAAGRMTANQVAPLTNRSVFDQGDVSDSERGDVMLF